VVLLELTGIVLVLGVVLLECVSTIRIIAGVVDVAVAAAAKAGVGAAVGKAAIAKARAAGEGGVVKTAKPAMKAAEPAATEAAKAAAVEPAKAAEAAAKRGGMLDPDGEPRGDRSTRQ
jgi:hypothetical protein